MSYRLQRLGGNTNLTTKLRCHNCGRLATLDRVGDVQDKTFQDPEHGNMVFGMRCCPNDECKALTFFVAQAAGQIEATYPPERLDFQTDRIPPNVLTAFSEAITCHAHSCYVAAGIMVRKTLEVLCADQGAEGKNLHERLGKLKEKVLLSPPLLDGFFELKLLGNDAAHIESKTYEQVGRAEVEAAINVTKEILKGIYQYQGLLEQLQALRKDAAP